MFDWLTGGSQQRQGQYGANQLSFDQYQAQRGLQAEQQAGYGQTPQFGFMGLGNPQTMDHYAAALGLPTSGEMQATYQNGINHAQQIREGSNIQGGNSLQAQFGRGMQPMLNQQHVALQNSPAHWAQYQARGHQFDYGYANDQYEQYGYDGYTPEYGYDQSYAPYEDDYYYEEEMPSTAGAHYTKRQKAGFLGIGSPSNEQMEAAITYLNKHFNRADDTGERDKFVSAGEIMAYANEIRDKRPKTAKALDELAQYVPQLMMAHIAGGDDAWNGLGKKDLALIAKYLKKHDFDELLAATQPLTSGDKLGNQLKVSK